MVGLSIVTGLGTVSHMERRKYQEDMLERVQRALQHARIMLQLPTGGGKTRIAGKLLSEWLKDGAKPSG